MCGFRTKFAGESGKQVSIKSSMKMPNFPALRAGMTIATSLAGACGMNDSSRSGFGVTGWSGLQISLESQSLHMLILLAKSATISEKLHQVGELGDLPKVILK